MKSKLFKLVGFRKILAIAIGVIANIQVYYAKLRSSRAAGGRAGL